jgi:hypothetical protein
MSAGLGSVPAEQTYLDISQGNRVFDSLYDSDLPPLNSKNECPAWWRTAVKRAESAPADIVPGLLTSTLEASGMQIRIATGTRAGVRAPCTFSAGEHLPADPIPPKKLSEGSRPSPGASPEGLSEDPHPARLGTLEVRSASLGDLPILVESLRGDDLLVALEEPPPARNEALAVGIAGRGFEGDLTSDSTRLDGYVLATDLAPTILRRFGLGEPDQMSGQPISSEGSVDAAAVASLGARLSVISKRRGPVIGLSLLVWILGLALAATVGGKGAAASATRVVGLSVVCLPLALLAAAALEPSQGAEQVLALAAPPLLGLILLAMLGGYRALAAASAATVCAYAIDMLAGSPLTSLSLLGPNPGLGVRFYGIGNELEALLSVLVVAGTGAALSGFAPRLSARACATAFLAAGIFFAFIFAAGRFGADVGAAIVLPLGAAVAAASIAARRRRTALLILAAPFVALAALVLLDLLSGANAHLTRSVLDAGGFGDLADVAQRRLQLSAHSFVRPVVLAFLPLVAALGALAVLRRDRLAAWLRGRAALRAGLLGALAATIVGTLANDSGALVLEIGAAYLLVFVSFAWAEAADQSGRYP